MEHILSKELQAFKEERIVLEEMKSNNKYSQDDIDKQQDRCIYLAQIYTYSLSSNCNFNK